MLKYNTAKLSGDSTATSKAIEEFLELMSPYLDKYVKILSGAKVDLSNNDTYRFYCLFVKRNFITVQQLDQLRESFKKFGKLYPQEDIRQELILILLNNVLEKFEKIEGIDFLLYCTNIFRYRVKDLFNRVMYKDAISKDSIDIDEAYDLAAPSQNQQIDIAWVINPINKQGKMLSAEERYIIYLHLYKNIPARKIASRLFITNKYLQEVIDKINKE